MLKDSKHPESTKGPVAATGGYSLEGVKQPHVGLTMKTSEQTTGLPRDAGQT